MIAVPHPRAPPAGWAAAGLARRSRPPGARGARPPAAAAGQGAGLLARRPGLGLPHPPGAGPRLGSPLEAHLCRATRPG